MFVAAQYLIYLLVCLFGNSMLCFPPEEHFLCISDFLLKMFSTHKRVGHFTQLNQSDLFLKVLVLSDLRMGSVWHFSLTTVTPPRESSLVLISSSLKLSSSLRGFWFFNLYIISINWFYCRYPDIVSIACHHRTLHAVTLKLKKSYSFKKSYKMDL